MYIASLLGISIHSESHYLIYERNFSKKELYNFLWEFFKSKAILRKTLYCVVRRDSIWFKIIQTTIAQITLNMQRQNKVKVAMLGINKMSN